MSDAQFRSAYESSNAQFVALYVDNFADRSITASQTVGSFTQAALADTGGLRTIIASQSVGVFTQAATLITAASPTVTTTTLADGASGVAYSVTLAATGSTPITWSVVSGALPSWASLNASTGALTGTPDAPALSSFTVRATNSSGTDDQSLTLLVPNGVGGEETVYPDRFATASQTLDEFTQTAVVGPLVDLTADQTVGNFTQTANLDGNNGVSIIDGSQTVGAFTQTATSETLIELTAEQAVEDFTQVTDVTSVSVNLTASQQVAEFLQTCFAVVGELGSMQIALDDAEVEVKQTATVTATVLNGSGDPVAGVNVTFSSGNEAIAAIYDRVKTTNGSGIASTTVYGNAYGAAALSARALSLVSGSVSLRVHDQILAVGETSPSIVTVRDINGDTIPSTLVVVHETVPGVVSVTGLDPTGPGGTDAFSITGAVPGVTELWFTAAGASSRRYEIKVT